MLRKLFCRFGKPPDAAISANKKSIYPFPLNYFSENYLKSIASRLEIATENSQPSPIPIRDGWTLPRLRAISYFIHSLRSFEDRTMGLWWLPFWVAQIAGEKKLTCSLEQPSMPESCCSSEYNKIAVGAAALAVFQISPKWHYKGPFWADKGRLLFIPPGKNTEYVNPLNIFFLKHFDEKIEPMSRAFMTKGYLSPLSRFLGCLERGQDWYPESPMPWKADILIQTCFPVRDWEKLDYVFNHGRKREFAHDNQH